MTNDSLTADAPGGPAAGDQAGDFIRVSDARRRYFGRTMSLRWWYRQVELGHLPHFRAGGAVLLRPADVEAFVATLFRDKAGPGPTPDPPPDPDASRRSRPRRGGLRFFGPEPLHD